MYIICIYIYILFCFLRGLESGVGSFWILPQGLQEFPDHSAPVLSATMSFDGTWVLTSSLVSKWEGRCLVAAGDWKPSPLGMIWCCSRGSSDLEAKLFETNTGRCLRSFMAKICQNAVSRCLSWTHDDTPTHPFHPWVTSWHLSLPFVGYFFLHRFLRFFRGEHLVVRGRGQIY